MDFNSTVCVCGSRRVTILRFQEARVGDDSQWRGYARTTVQVYIAVGGYNS